VALHGVMDFPAPRFVLALWGKNAGRLRDDLPETVNANRKVRTPHQSAAARLHGLPHASKLLKPSSRARHHWNAERGQLANILHGRRGRGKFHRRVDSAKVFPGEACPAWVRPAV